jgi:hypothetical protein
MAQYPIKMLKDEEGLPFVPLVSTECIQDPEGKSLEQRLATRLGPDNLLGGENITVRPEGSNCYIDLDLPASLNIIDNLNTASSGQGALDAHQGNILKNMIPGIVDDVTSTDATKVLSARQGYVLNNKFNEYAKANTLAPVATSGKYSDLTGSPTIVNNLISTSKTDTLSAAQGKILNDKFANYLPLTGGNLTGSVVTSGNLCSEVSSGEATVKATYQNKGIYLFANADTHGVYDHSYGSIIYVSGAKTTDKKFQGVAAMAQQDTSGYGLTGMVKGGDSGGDNFYVKYSNGILICCKRVSFSNVPISTAWGSLYDCGTAIDLGDWPCAFAYTPVTSVEIQSTNGVFTQGHQRVSTTSAGSVWLTRAQSSPGVSGYLTVIGIGKWATDQVEEPSK